MVSSASVHAQVGALITRVSEDFKLAALLTSSATAIDQETEAAADTERGANQAAHALQLAFELLRSGTVLAAAAPAGAQVLDSNVIGVGADEIFTEGGGKSLLREKKEAEENGDVMKVARRAAFLRSSFLPFASFLLRDVGPTWLPIWDRLDTTLAATAVTSADSADADSGTDTTLDRTEAPPTTNEKSVVYNLDQGSRPSGTFTLVQVPGVSGHSSGTAAQAHGTPSKTGVHQPARGKHSNIDADLQDEDAMLPRPVSARDMFMSFFGPPLVPASLALLALFEGLGSRPSLPPFSSETHSTVTRAADFWGGGTSQKYDARTVQLACRLLEPYLDPLLRQLPTHPGDSTHYSKEHYFLMPQVDDEPTEIAAEIEGHEESAAVESKSDINGADTPHAGSLQTSSHVHQSADPSSSLEQEKADDLRHGDDKGEIFRSRTRHPLFIQALIELAVGEFGVDQVQPSAPPSHETHIPRSSEQGTDGSGGVGGRNRGRKMAARDAAERLMSAVCLAPQRVANALGPLAPPAFIPEKLFSAVCRAVVRSILLSFSIPADEAVNSVFEGRGRGVALHGSVVNGLDVDSAAKKSAAAISRADGIGSGEFRERRQSEIEAKAMTRDVWRAFSERLLVAGRASDLADAWLQTIFCMGAAGEKPNGQTLLLNKSSVGTSVSAVRTAIAACDDGASNNRGDHSNHRGRGEPHPVASTQTTSCSTPSSVAALWEAWAGDSQSDVHAWMMRAIPPLCRKSFTEALLRALWPPDPSRSRHRRRHVELAEQRYNDRDGRKQAWPPGFPLAACRTLIGMNLVARRSASLGDEGIRGETAAEEAAEAELAAVEEDEIELWVSLLEDLLLHRPLPLPAADAIADTLAWCDRRAEMEQQRVVERDGVGDGRWGAAVGGGDGSITSRRKRRRKLVVGALQRVATVWAEPPFINSSPPRQQEFYTRFLLAALRSGTVDGLSLAAAGAAESGDAVTILVRGVGTHLDVSTRATRLQGMRVGEAVAALSGHELRFEELDFERCEKTASETAAVNGGGEERGGLGIAQGMNKKGLGPDDTAGSGDRDAKSVSAEERGISGGRKGRRRNSKKSVARIDKGERKNTNHFREEENTTIGGGGAWKGRVDMASDTGRGGKAGGLEHDIFDDLDPDMVLGVGGSGGGFGVQGDSDDDDDNDDGRFVEEHVPPRVKGVGVGNTGDAKSGDDGGCHASSPQEEDSWDDDDEDDGDDDDVDDVDDDDDDYDDEFEAYDMRDDQADLAKVAVPVYLDQLIEMLRSREDPDMHETALAHAEALVRRNPPDLAHRATELARDLLYMDNSFDLEGFETLRARSLVATTAQAPETCALYLGGEIWGTGASEGTKLLILDILVKAASELAGWSPPQNSGDAEDSGGNRAFPSALMREARGTTQGSVRLDRDISTPKVTTTTTTTTATLAKTSKANNAARIRNSELTAPATSAEDGNGHAAHDDAEIRHRDGSTARGQRGPERTAEQVAASGLRPSRTRRWGYRRGPREKLRRNLFGRFAPVFFYPLAQGLIQRLRESAAKPPGVDQDSTDLHRVYALQGGYITPPLPPPPPPSALLSGRLLHTLTCLVELCGNCPATPALAADLLGLAWLLRIRATENRELKRAILLALATGIEHSQDGGALALLQMEPGAFLRWLTECASGTEQSTRELAALVLEHRSVQTLLFLGNGTY